PGVAGERLSAPATPPSMLEVAYDRATGLLSIQARDTPLDTVLQALSKQVPFRLDAWHQELLNEPISVELRHLSLERALREVLRGFNAVFLSSSASDQPIRIILLSRIQAATDPTTVKEGAQTVEALLETLHDKDLPARAGAIALLKGFAPEKAVAVLEQWLQENDPESRVFAADQLGDVGGERAIEALTPFLTEEDPRTRQVVANSLARIGGDSVRQSLIAAFREGDNALKLAALKAIASYGDETSQEALAAQL